MRGIQKRERAVHLLYIFVPDSVSSQGQFKSGRVRSGSEKSQVKVRLVLGQGCVKVKVGSRLGQGRSESLGWVRSGKVRS